MVDARILKLCLSGLALTSASPAFASDFSGFGRAFNWLLFAVIFLVTVTIVFLRNRGKVFGIAPNALIALCASVLFAPGICFQFLGFSETIFTIFPGSLLAALDGRVAPLWPSSFFSMLVFFVIAYLLLQRRDRRNSVAGGEAE